MKDANPGIIEDLRKRGLLFREEKIVHTYPFCWRCDSPLIYYAHPSWYVKTTSFKDEMIALNKTINWVPKEFGDNRFGQWLENNVDWALEPRPLLGHAAQRLGLRGLRQGRLDRRASPSSRRGPMELEGRDRPAPALDRHRGARSAPAAAR